MAPPDLLAEQIPLLVGYGASSIQERIATGPRAGHPVRRLRTATAVVDGEKRRCARLEGVSLCPSAPPAAGESSVGAST